MQTRFEEITQLIDDFCQKYLNEEYATLCRQLTAALCRKRPSPLVTGDATAWACGIVHAIGSVNFLFDRTQNPHMKASELAEKFGLSLRISQTKSKQIRDLFNMGVMEPDWTLPSKMDSNPMAWHITLNGFIIDARQAPLDIQAEAYRKGLIPYIPALKQDQ